MDVLKSINPADGTVVGEVRVTPPAEVGAIVARARAAQPGWADAGIEARAALLRQVGERLRERTDEIARLICAEMGKPLHQAAGEAGWVCKGIDGAIDEVVAALQPEVLTSERTRTTVYRDPFGVAACISPWNFPVGMAAQQVVPALLAGNTVVLKPSEEVPLVGQLYADAFLEVLPDGVMQVVHGADEQGKALVAADVDLIVFTGSRAAGKHILRAASAELKRVILELGGKDPLIVLSGADLDRAARFAASNSFRNAGQVCVSTERIYVEADIHDDFVDALRGAAASMQVGVGTDPDTVVGPMVNQTQRDHVAAQVAEAVADGARVVFESESPGPNFHPLTILTDVRQEMGIIVEETFGPVAAVLAVSDADQAVRMANDSPYGLGAVVFGPSERASAAARRLNAGMIGVNQGISTAGSTPWVGARQSGYGFHSGVEGHRQFAQVRLLSEAL